MQGIKKAWKTTFNFFDKLEDKIRFRLSHRPILYAIVGAIGIILVWKGVWDMADEFHLMGIAAFTLGVVILLATGLLVSFFIGDTIIISGFKREKKLVDKTERELLDEQSHREKIMSELKHIEEELEDIRQETTPAAEEKSIQ